MSFVSNIIRIKKKDGKKELVHEFDLLILFKKENTTKTNELKNKLNKRLSIIFY